MDLKLHGKVAIITGASKGIGKAIAQTLAAEGMRLVLVARGKELLEELAASLPTENLVYSEDLCNPEAAKRIVTAALERFDQLDALVNNAGAAQRGDPLEFGDDAWADGFALKFFGAMRLCRAAWPALRTTSGAIVNIAGVGGRMASADFAIGGSVNAALMYLSKALADRGAADGVRVNALNPGAIATDRLLGRIRAFAKEHSLDEGTAALEMAKELNVSRFGQPEEIARVVAFLLSPNSSYIQGAVLDIDGGYTKGM